MQLRARELGVRVLLQDSYLLRENPFLSDVAKTFAGGPWLKHFFPEVNKKAAREFIGTLDRTISIPSRSCAPRAYALALALLYESADVAMCEVTSLPAPEDPMAAPNATLTSEESCLAVHESPALTDECDTPAVRAAVRAFAAGTRMSSVYDLMGVAPHTLEKAIRSVLAKQLSAGYQRT